MHQRVKKNLEENTGNSRFWTCNDALFFFGFTKHASKSKKGTLKKTLVICVFGLVIRAFGLINTIEKMLRKIYIY